VAPSQTSRVQDLADRDGLGQLQQHYHGRFRQSVVAVTALAVFVAVVGGLSLLSGSTEVGLTLSLMSLPFLGVTMWMWVWEFRHSNDAVHVFDGGLVHVSRGGAVHSYPWNSITDVRVRKMEVSVEDIPVRTVHFVKLVRGDGPTLVLNNRLRGIAGLSGKVQDEVARAQLPGALDALRAGSTINFDGLMIDALGIRHGGSTIPWPSVVTIGVMENITSTKVTVRASDRRRPYTRRLFPSRPFPNVLLLATIARTLHARPVAT
jgi:hypothetical protein